KASPQLAGRAQAMSDSHRQWMANGGSFIIETQLDEHYNLPLVLAYAVLEDALRALWRQGAFKVFDRSGNPHPDPKLWAMMSASTTSLRWQGYKFVNKGRVARNDVAHQAKLKTKEDCLGYIDAIETELKAWSVISKKA